VRLRRVARPKREVETGKLGGAHADPGDRKEERLVGHVAESNPDGDGSVLGIDGLVVADASIMPTIPGANTSLTAVAIAERISTVV
jgi:hypothetical protein